MVMEELSVSTRVKCSECGLEYELGACWLDESSGQRLPWFIVETTSMTPREGIAKAVCQLCHGFQMGTSLKGHIESFQITLAGPEPLLTREEVGRRAAELRKMGRLPILPRTAEAPKPRREIGRASAVTPTSTPTRPLPARASQVKRPVPVIGPATITSQTPRQVIGPGPSSKTSVQRPMPVAVSNPTRPQPHLPIAAMSRPAEGRTPVQPRRPVEPKRSARPVRPVQPQVAKQAPVPTREHDERPIKPERPLKSNLGQAILQRLDEAVAKGERKLVESQLNLAVAANLDHPLVRKFLADKAETKRKADETVRKQEELVKRRSFSSRMGHARRVFREILHSALTQDVGELIDRLYKHIASAAEVDPKRRSSKELLKEFGTSSQHLEYLAVAFYAQTYLTSRIVPVIPDEDRSFTHSDGAKVLIPRDDRVYLNTTCVPRTDPVMGPFERTKMGSVEVLRRFDGLPRPNRPVWYSGQVIVRKTKLPKIVYDNGDEYGRGAYLVMPDNRHRFQEVVSRASSLNLETFLGKGQKALMEYRPGIGWVYEPLCKDESSARLDFRVGSFERGFVSSGNIHVLTVVLCLNGWLIGTTLTKVGRVRPFEEMVDTAKSSKQVIVLNPDPDLQQIEFGKANVLQPPTATSCVVLTPGSPSARPHT